MPYTFRVVLPRAAVLRNTDGEEARTLGDAGVGVTPRVRAVLPAVFAALELEASKPVISSLNAVIVGTCTHYGPTNQNPPCLHPKAKHVYVSEL